MPKKSLMSGEVVYVRPASAESDAQSSEPLTVSVEPVATPLTETVKTHESNPPRENTDGLPGIAPTTLQKQRVKKPMTDAKKAHMARLAEMNRQKREEAKQAKVPPIDIPEPAGDAVRMAVKPKRQYKKKDRDFWEAITTHPTKKAEIEALPANEVVIPEVVELAPKRRLRTTPAPSAPVPAPPPSPPPPPARPKPVKAPKERVSSSKSRAPRKVRYVEPSSDEESEESSSDEEEVERVVRKAQKRMSTLDKIDQRLRMVRNPYEALGLSAF
jgi:hypothetical protein